MTLLEALLRFRLAVGATLAFALGWFDALSKLTPVDHVLFSDAADRLFSERWADAFIDKRVQVGPLYLAFLAGMRNLAQAAGVDPRELLCVVIEVAVTLGVMLTVRALAGTHAWAAALELAAGVAALVGGVAWTAWASGHPEEVAIGLMWIWSARLARARKAAGAGSLLALAAGLKLWGLLGVPVLLLCSEPRHRALATGLFVALVALAYAPFLLLGEVNTFEFRWPVDSPLLQPFADADGLFPWPLRIVQGLAAVAFGAVVAVRMRNRVHVEWALPLAIVIVRIVLDPLPHYYFWLPIEAMGLVAAAALATTQPRVVAAASGTAVYVMLAWRYMPDQSGFFYRVVICGALLFLAARGPGLVGRQIQHQV